MTEIDLSIVIIEYHCVDLIEECLDSVQKRLAGMTWECIVISNSEYSPEELKEMQRRLPSARVISNIRNRGYAGGVNRALPECNAPYVFILNPDCRLVDDNVPELIATMENNPILAVLGPKVVDEHGEIQPSCRRFPRPWTFLLVRSALQRLPNAGAERRRYLMEDFDHGTHRDVDWVSGGAMLIRKLAVDRVGPMDERFFLYMEDVDWCKRFWKVGYHVAYFPGCTVVHAGQHASLPGGLRGIVSRHTRLHLASMGKYFLKYGLK